jgi:PAS domain S-box-containing protein
MQQTERLDAPNIEENRYRMLIEAVIDYAIYMLDRDGLIVSWNAGARRFKGYEEAEILGEHFSRFYTAADRERGMPQRALDIAAREGRFEGEGLRVRKDGSTFWASVVIDPILSPEGTVLGFAKVTRDLTERRRAEESLKKSEEQFRLLVQSVIDYAIYMLDPQGRITNWNLGAQRIKGYLPEEVIGQHFSMFYGPEDRLQGEPQRGLDTALREGRFENQGWRVRKDGSRFWANVVIDTIRSETGELIGFAKITRDITEAMQAQRELELAREELFQSQKMESIGQLTGGIAHDFNNLLMVVLGSLELVRKRLPEDPRITPLLDNAILGAQRGASLTQRMLAFARRQELKLEMVDAPALVRGMSELLQSSLGPRMRIELRFPLSLRSVLADSNQLELALLNLAVNARDAMPEGGLIVIAAREERVEKDEYLDAGDYVCLTLTDSGTGMDEQTLSRATEPFFTTKGIGKGTGLGLSMVHGFAEQSGGRCRLFSELGRGTTVELWLPVAQPSPTPECEETESSHDPLRTAALNVLVVDDDGLVLSNTVAMLEDLGHTVLQADSAAHALEILAGGATIDLVITDQAMPQMTGVELAKLIRQRWPGLPVLLATGYAEYLESSLIDLPRLNKPFGQEALARTVHDTMQSHSKHKS